MEFGITHVADVVVICVYLLLITIVGLNVGRIFSSKSVMRTALSTIVLLVQYVLKVIITVYDDVTALQYDVTSHYPSYDCCSPPLTSLETGIAHPPELANMESVSTNSECSVSEPKSAFEGTEAKLIAVSSNIVDFVRSAIEKTVEENHIHFVQELQSIWTNNNGNNKYNFNIQLLNIKPQL